MPSPSTSAHLFCRKLLTTLGLSNLQSSMGCLLIWSVQLIQLFSRLSIIDRKARAMTAPMRIYCFLNTTIIPASPNKKKIILVPFSARGKSIFRSNKRAILSRLRIKVKTRVINGNIHLFFSFCTGTKYFFWCNSDSNFFFCP